MADEPKNPQQIIDDATKALGQSPPSGIPTPIPIATPPLMQTTPVEPQPTVNPPLAETPPSPIQPSPNPIVIPLPPPPPILPLPPTPQKPELIVIPPKDQQQEPPQTIVKPPKKKGGKGLLIGMLLFFILTLPVAIYYIVQSPQFAEIRSRAAGRCEQARTSGICINIECNTYTSQTGCTSGTGTCCRWIVISVPTPPPSGACTSGQTKSCTTAQNCPGRYDCVNGVWSTACFDIADNCPPRIFPTAGPAVTNTPIPDHCVSDGSASGNMTCPGATKSACCLNRRVCSWSGSGGCPAIIVPTVATGGCSSIKAYSPSMTAVPCNHYSGSTITTQGTFQGKCVFYHCPRGCTASCGESTPGFTMEFGNCNSGKLGTNECGQIDTVDGNNTYCAPTTGCESSIQCTNQGYTCAQVAVVNTPVPINTPVPTTINTPVPTTINTPVPTATNAPEPTATNAPEPTATNAPGNTSAPGTCDASCDTDSNCESGLSCYLVTGVKRCRKAACADRSNCECPLAAEPTATTRYYQPGQPTAIPTTERVIAEAPVTTATQMPTPKVPVSGIIDVKAIIITVGSILLLVLGLIL